ncbi:YibE/F family protein [Lactovum miscens]|uniref:Putative membrane protein n=1 Tax=Lactovum miscens TaxID=190387 RepID=A0A841C6J2_9LACT|nr:YibE/F family protein [Lactovum miscens]MBB5887887.1 putative membrane protein [Lactovum miscens]
MNTILVMSIVLLLLMVLISGKTGLRNIFGLFLNLIVILVFIILANWQINLLLLTLATSIIILTLAIFMSSEDNHVTTIAYKSSLLVVLPLILLAFIIQYLSQIQGFSVEQADELETLSLSVGLNFSDLAVSIMTISMLGAVAEAAMAITANLIELIEKNPYISSSSLAAERLLISKQIMGTAINTLFFGMLGSSLPLILWYVNLNENLSLIINSKLLLAEAMTMFLGILAIIFTIELASHYVIMERKKSI